MKHHIFRTSLLAVASALLIAASPAHAKGDDRGEDDRVHAHEPEDTRGSQGEIETRRSEPGTSAGTIHDSNDADDDSDDDADDDSNDDSNDDADDDDSKDDSNDDSNDDADDDDSKDDSNDDSKDDSNDDSNSRRRGSDQARVPGTSPVDGRPAAPRGAKAVEVWERERASIEREARLEAREAVKEYRAELAEAGTKAAKARVQKAYQAEIRRIEREKRDALKALGTKPTRRPTARQR